MKVLEKYFAEENPRDSAMADIGIVVSARRVRALCILIPFMYLIGVVCIILGNRCKNEDFDILQLFA